MYRDLERDPGRRLPAACEAYEDGISLGVLSKSAGLPGLRIGWLATRRGDILDQVAAVKDYGTICSSGPSELLAGIAARHFGALARRSRAIIEANLALVEAFFARRPGFASWTAPEGGSTGFPRLMGGEGGFDDAAALARKLVAEAGVMILPGSCYGYDRAYFRLGFGRVSLSEALAVLDDWLDRRKK